MVKLIILALQVIKALFDAFKAKPVEVVKDVHKEKPKAVQEKKPVIDPIPPVTVAPPPPVYTPPEPHPELERLKTIEGQMSEEDKRRWREFLGSYEPNNKEK